MKLLGLVRRDSTLPLGKVLFMASLAGLSNASVLAIINVAAEQAANQSQSFRYLVLFALAILIYILSQKYILFTTTAEVEAILHRIRRRIAQKIRGADLEPLEKIGRSQIYASVSKETLTISEAAGIVVAGCQSGILVFFTIFYIAWLSKTAFFLFVLFIGMAITVHFKNVGRMNRYLHAAVTQENRLFETLTHMLDGFKEVKMSAARSDALFAAIDKISGKVADIKTRFQKQHAIIFIFSQSSFYVLLAVMAFLLPRLSVAYTDVTIKVTTAILFIVGPITTMVSAVPILASANVAVENIDRLEQELERAASPAVDGRHAISSFRTVGLEGATFRFTDPRTTRPFRVGPLDLSVDAGELLFIAGGNGAGKSTFLKLLTSLYYPESGAVEVDGKPIGTGGYPAYRDLFSIIFSDYHLFDRLYGMDEVDPERVEALLAELELDGLTELDGDRFTNLDLSSGQRKRLALLVSLLEDKPIYAFDEWAADQDPAFRRKFYEVILPRLRDEGKTVLVVTHDDRYFRFADRLLEMEDGRFVDRERSGKTRPSKETEPDGGR